MPQATSQIEKHFQMHSIYKRSKDVLDMEQINSKELKHEINRRKPTQSVETLDTRVDSSFMNAFDARNQRLNQDINKFKKRYQSEDEQLNQLVEEIYGGDEGAKQYIKESKKVGKGADWSKMLGRSYDWERKPVYNNQDRFSNYNFGVSPNKSKSLIIRKEKPSKNKFTFNQENMEEFDSVKIGQVAQNIRYDAVTLKCLIQYDKKDQYKKLSRALPPIPLKQLDPFKIEKAKKLTSPNTTSHMQEFYMTESMEAPSQMAIRLNKDNQYYFPFRDERNSGDIGAQMRKQRMLLKRVEKILSGKKGSADVRGELCDEKYFKRRQLRLKKGK